MNKTYSLTSACGILTLMLIAAFALFLPRTSFAFTESQTVANVTAGTSDQTDTTVITQTNLTLGVTDQTAVTATPTPASGGVAQINTVTIGGTVETNDVFTINVPAGIVTYTVTSGATTTANIASGIAAALIATSTYAAAPYVVSTSTNVVTLTAKVVNTPFTQTSGTTNRSARAQINTISVGGTVDAGDVFTINVPAGVVTYTVTTDTTTTNIANGIGAALVATSTYAAAAYTVSTSTNTVVLTAKVAGTGFTQTSGTTNRAAVAQVVTFTPQTLGNIDYTITLNGSTYAANGSTNVTAGEVVAGLNAALAGNSVASCSEDGVKVTCTALVAGTPFTYSSEESAAGNGGHHSSGGSGSSHSSGSNSSSSSSSSSSTSDLQSKIDMLKMQLTALIAKMNGSVASAPAASGSFTMDLDVGSTGADVKMLQAYLNAKGFTVAATGPGSVGYETMTFGGATKAALAKFQAAKGIMPAAGFFGPKTRAYMIANP